MNIHAVNYNMVPDRGLVLIDFISSWLLTLKKKKSNNLTAFYHLKILFRISFWLFLQPPNLQSKKTDRSYEICSLFTALSQDLHQSPRAKKNKKHLFPGQPV